MLNERYAREIAEKWNKHSADSDFEGYVTVFGVEAAYMLLFTVQTVGASYHREYWIPAEELENFNRHIVGYIEVIE